MWHQYFIVTMYFLPFLRYSIMSWPWNLGLRSFEVIENGTTREHFVGSMTVCEIFNVKECHDLENWVRGCSRSLKMAPFDRPYTTFTFYSNYGSILHRFRVKARYWSKIVTFFILTLHSTPLLGAPSRNIAIPFSTENLNGGGYPVVQYVWGYV